MRSPLSVQVGDMVWIYTRGFRKVFGPYPGIVTVPPFYEDEKFQIDAFIIVPGTSPEVNTYIPYGENSSGHRFWAFPERK